MLELKNLTKSYTTAGFTQKALDEVTVTLRDNEFVAVLGPSGSGKTTLLNIVGGLDRYDSGNLVIDGIPTDVYKDRDWDTYRNNRVGFVFQSYNLIPHQSVLSNVELALTLSGVPKAERRERARAALTQVGLEEHMSKKPNQLSGGQMQRVAIARALINDPEILLADEPTGALDSKTSTQIMDLLKEIATDRLVVMVTHNPDLADAYANRVINLYDGQITGDSNPVLNSELEHEARPPRKARMSFFTAISLSFSNLMTKKGRTLMMAFAGSIGIIGIAAILALSNGVNNYIKSVEEETLSVYPLSITSTGFNITSLLVGTAGSGDDSSSNDNERPSFFEEMTGGTANEEDRTVTEFPVVSSMFDTVQSNDLGSLKEYLEGPECNIRDYVNTIQYQYDVTPQIFLPLESDVRQVNPDSSFAALGLGSGMSSSSLLSMSMSTDVFFELLDDFAIYSDQYDVLEGRWPTSADELVIVLGSANRIGDFLLYPLGLRDHRELNAMVEAFINNEEIPTTSDRLSFTYDDLMAVELRLVYNSDVYSYDENYEVWVDRSDDIDFMKKLVAGAKPLHICGIVTASADNDTQMLSPGIYYTAALIEDIVGHSAASRITKDQLANPTVNIFTGKTFLEEAEENSSREFDMGNLFSVDEEALTDAFGFDTSALGGLDFAGVLDPNAVVNAMPAMDLMSAFGGISLTNIDPGTQTALMNVAFDVANQVTPMYGAWCLLNSKDPSDQASFNEFMNDPDPLGYGYSTQEKIIEIAMSNSDSTYLMAQLVDMQDMLQFSFASYMQSYMTTMLTIMAQQIGTNMSAAMSSLTASLSDAMHIDTDLFTSAFQFNLDEAELTALMLSMMGQQESSLDGNLRKLGYANFDTPTMISIYPIDFESKQAIIDILDAYNDRMTAAGDDEKVITYTDIVGTLMSSVTTIIDMISMVLVAFVSISLVVSSIMIGVITYISVLERKKEIGILRSIGASKGDIANVFNAETLIVGFVAGLMGIAIVLLLSIPANALIEYQTGVPTLVLLPVQAGLILIGVSCFLTLVAGLMPSSAASRKDPVEALRSE